MCGIFGFIGQPIHPKANYALLTNLGLETEHRGKEATGIWGAQGGKDGQIIYHKEPIPATKFMEKSMWKSLSTFNPHVLLVHCREPTTGGGLPSINKNNHPHVNDDCTIGLIHNGRVEEYYKFKDQFKDQIKSQCDSELLLRVFETGERVPSDDLLKRYPQLDQENFYRLFGIEQIFKKFEKTHMAVAVGERHYGTKRSLWLFRNEKRPMQVIDLRSSMGVIYFCSTMSIWRQAVEATSEVKNIIPNNHDVIDFPIYYAYSLSFDPEAKDELYTAETDPARIGKPVDGGWKNGWRIRKYRLDIKKEEGVEEEEVLAPLDIKTLQNVKVFTSLNDDDVIQPTPSIISIGDNTEEAVLEIASETVTDTMSPESPVIRSNHSIHVIGNSTASSEGKYTYEPEPTTETTDEPTFEESFDLDKLASLTEEIKNIITDIGVETSNNAVDGSITPSGFKDLLDNLEQIKADVIGIKYTVFPNGH